MLRAGLAGAHGIITNKLRPIHHGHVRVLARERAGPARAKGCAHGAVGPHPGAHVARRALWAHWPAGEKVVEARVAGRWTVAELWWRPI
jgi:hypothetical protein